MDNKGETFSQSTGKKGKAVNMLMSSLTSSKKAFRKIYTPQLTSKHPQCLKHYTKSCMLHLSPMTKMYCHDNITHDLLECMTYVKVKP